jgi:alpha-L-rhamnosidase
MRPRLWISVLTLYAAGAWSPAAGPGTPTRPAETRPAAEPAGTPITQFGAVGDGRTMNTVAIQAGVDKLAAAGGGTLVVPEGVFLSGAVFLKPGVNLHLAKGAVLKGSTDINDYPNRPTRIEGHSEAWRCALVNADRVDRLRITGEGTLDGSGSPFWAAFWQRRKENPNCTNLEVERPRLVFIQDCKDVLVSGVTLKDSGFWNLHLYRCQNVVVERIDVHVPAGTGQKPPSTDAVDVDSCQHVAIRDCTFAVNDDCIALKGTKGPFALDDKDSPPVEDVRVAGCTFKAGHAALTCGSEATIVRDVVLERCTVTGNMPLLHLKLRPDTPQAYQDIAVRDVLMQDGTVFDVSPWTQFFDLHGQPPPKSVVRGVTVSGLTGSFKSLGRISGNKDTKMSDITLENVDAKAKSTAFEHRPDLDGLTVRNVKLNDKPYAAE